MNEAIIMVVVTTSKSNKQTRAMFDRSMPWLSSSPCGMCLCLCVCGRLFTATNTTQKDELWRPSQRACSNYHCTHLPAVSTGTLTSAACALPWHEQMHPLQQLPTQLSTGQPAQGGLSG